MIARYAFLALAWLLLGATSLQATTYYVDNASGRDGNSGTSTSAPWQTLDKVNNAQLQAGDRVLFRRDREWRGQLKARSGAQNNPIVYGAYGEGARPRIVGSTQLRQETGAWTSVGGGVWRYANTFGVDVGSLSFDGRDDLVGTKRGSQGELTQNGDFYLDGGGVLYLRASANPGSRYSRIEGALRRDIVDLNYRNYVTIENLHLTRGGGHGARGTNTSGITIQDCEISWIGGGYLPLGTGPERYGNGVEFWAATYNARVRRNYIHDIFDSGVTNQYFDSPAQDQIDIFYESNVIVNCGLASFEMANSTGGKSVYIRFENNTCINGGGGWGAYNSRQRQGSVPGAVIGAQVSFTNAQVPNSENSLYITNNLFYNAGDMFIYHNAYWQMWDQTVLRNNDYFVSTSGNPKIYLKYAPSGQTVYYYDQFELYRSQQGKDQNSLRVDPKLTNVGGQNYRPTSTSPLIRAGAPVANDALDIERRARPDNAPVTIGAYEISGSTTPTPTPTPTPSGQLIDGATYQLIHKGTTKALDVVWNQSTSGANVQQWETNGTFGQRWIARLRSDGIYALQHAGTDQCLTVEGNSTNNGANVRQETCNSGSGAQAWAIARQSDGFYRVAHAGTSKVLDIANVSGADGANAQQWDDGGGNNQRWGFERVDGASARVAAGASAAAPTVDGQPLRVYPNPARDRLTVELPGEGTGPLTYTFTDAAGRRSAPRDATQSGGVVQVELEGLPAGTYTLSARADGREHRCAVVVQE